MSHSHGHHGGNHHEVEELERRMGESLARIRHKILVMSGKGGVGKSTVAANLAVALAKRGYRTGLMDVDLHGPTIPQLMGLAGQQIASDNGKLIPLPYNEHLSVLSMGALLPERDAAVIWRGPMKIGVIRQFLGDAEWGELDFLVVDSPPGTGDEPLTVAQDMPGVRAVVVTTPQEVSLADVRKSLNFCHQVNMPVAGVIENMSGYACANCGHLENLFGSGGGEKMAQAMGVPFLGKIPLDRHVVASGEQGRPLLDGDGTAPAAAAYESIVSQLLARLEPASGPALRADGPTRLAIPVGDGDRCAHFADCRRFALVTVEGGRIVKSEWLTPPSGEQLVVAPWLKQQGADVVIAAGMGSRAQEALGAAGVRVVVGAANETPAAIVQQYLAEAASA